MSNWQPIETAPDGAPTPDDKETYILVFGGRYKTVTCVPADGSWWRLYKTSKATPAHWMPLPAPPKEQEAGK